MTATLRTLMKTELDAKNAAAMIGWKYFVLCVLRGLAPYGLLMACLPLFNRFNCKLDWQTVCDGPAWVVTFVDVVAGISWLVMLTMPVGLIFLIAGAAVNWNRWIFGSRRKAKVDA